MMGSYDRSHKDMQYFIDDKTYNCPFCNRKNINYQICKFGRFHPSNTTDAYYYSIQCGDLECKKISFHLSRYPLTLTREPMPDGTHILKDNHRFAYPPRKASNHSMLVYDRFNKVSHDNFKKDHKEILDDDMKPIKQLDDVFYFHQPSSFFTIDERIPNSIRKPLSEAYNCLKSNFITGASAGLRKAIYKLLKDQAIKYDHGNGNFLKHHERIELLKEKLKNIVDSELIAELDAVHDLTSQELHENDWEDFSAKDIKYLLEVIKEILFKIYIEPEEKNIRKERLKALKLQSKPLKDQNKI